MDSEDQEINQQKRMLDKIFSVLGQKSSVLYYDLKDTIIYTLCYCLRKKLRQKNSKFERFQMSRKHLSEELDVISFIRNIRYLKGLMKILLPERERRLLMRLR